MGAIEAEVIRSEEDAQKAYEDFGKDIVNKSESKAKAEADRVEAKEDKEAVMLELEQLANYKAELHSSCDFVMKNFDIRQTARDEEIEALKQAKAILSGAKFEAFLQSWGTCYMDRPTGSRGDGRMARLKPKVLCARE